MKLDSSRPPPARVTHPGNGDDQLSSPGATAIQLPEPGIAGRSSHVRHMPGEAQGVRKTGPRSGGAPEDPPLPQLKAPENRGRRSGFLVLQNPVDRTHNSGQSQGHRSLSPRT